MGDLEKMTGNDTPNTPPLSETELRAMHIDQLRERAKREGVEHADQLGHDELVGAISIRYRQATGEPSDGVRPPDDDRRPGAARAADGGGNETPNTPPLSETELRGMQIDRLRERARQEGVEQPEGLRYEELVREVSARYRQG